MKNLYTTIIDRPWNFLPLSKSWDIYLQIISSLKLATLFLLQDWSISSLSERVNEICGTSLFFFLSCIAIPKNDFKWHSFFYQGLLMVALFFGRVHIPFSFLLTQLVNKNQREWKIDRHWFGSQCFHGLNIIKLSCPSTYGTILVWKYWSWRTFSILETYLSGQV